MTGIPLPTAPVGAAGAAATGARPDTDRLRETAQEFEAMFLHQMLSAMRQGTAEDNPLGGPDSPFGSLLQAEQAKIIAKAGGIGVADAILHELLKTQEVPS